MSYRLRLSTMLHSYFHSYTCVIRSTEGPFGCILDDVHRFQWRPEPLSRNGSQYFYKGATANSEKSLSGCYTGSDEHRPLARRGQIR
jgi:hypothetical protein